MKETKILRVAQIIGVVNAGGVEACIMNYYKNIDRSKIQFDFFVENTGPIIDKEIIESLGGKVVIIPSYKKVFKYMKTLKKLFIDGKYDIVHSNMNALSVFTLRAAKQAGIKIRIAHSHSTSNPKEILRSMIKNVLKLFSKKYATHYFACSELAGRWLFGNKAYEAGKVFLINNGVFIETFRYDETLRETMRQSLHIENNQFVLGNIGRLCAQKNQVFLIEIFKEVLKINTNSTLLLVGEGSLKDKLRKKINNLNLENKVIFVGANNNVHMLYDAMDCFVFPSLYEGLGMTLIEAQISGLDCFASLNVPQIAKVNDNVEFLSLDLSAKEWAKQISQCFEKENRDGFDRKKISISFNSKMYDITAQSLELYRLYIMISSNVQ